MSERERFHRLVDKRLNYEQIVAIDRYDIPVWPPTTLEKDEIKGLLEEALSIDGAHHKQWYLWRIAEALDIELPDDLADKGIAP